MTVARRRHRARSSPPLSAQRIPLNFLVQIRPRHVERTCRLAHIPVERAELAEALPQARFISAKTGEGVDALFADLGAQLPESPFLYPEDEISTASVRFFVAELVRETALEQLDEEVPYSLACEVEEFREAQSPVYIRTVLYVERESQKRILIGSGGQRIHAIGRAARTKVEAFVGAGVYLDLWVKVLPNWRKSDSAIRRFGYRLHDDPSA